MNPLRRSKSSGGSAGLGGTSGPAAATSEGGAPMFFPAAGISARLDFNPLFPATGAPSVGSFTQLMHSGMQAASGFLPLARPSFTADTTLSEVPIARSAATRGGRKKRAPIAPASTANEDDVDVTDARISGDPRMMPYFKDCIGALDGTHVTTTPPPKDLIRYIGRSGKPTQNVMDVVDFDLRFTYASIGQPGSMHDTNVLYHALEQDKKNFPHPPIGKYYQVDAGYPNRLGYLAPYKGQRYHVPDWRRGPAPSGKQELFNHLHSSIRNAVERTFGVWKMKWRVLLKMPSYPMDKQMMIVAATMCLHNFIRENSATDKDFSKCDRNVDYVPTIPERYAKYFPSRTTSDTSTPQSSIRSMDKFCYDIARTIFRDRSS